jgi:glycerol dehydrogenase
MQGPGAIEKLADVLDELGCRKPVVVVDAVIRDTVWSPVEERLSAAGCAVSVLAFPGECTLETIRTLAGQARSADADCVIGFGGGKTIDTAKGIARECGARLVIAPTIASNDSPTSRLIVLYDDRHKVSAVHMLARNPDVVLVDTQIVARAPARFFAAGLGDALSKKDESEQCHKAGGKNFFGTPSLPLARLFGRQCRDTILEFGQAALAQIDANHEPNDDVERAVEASVLMSGLAFESGGLSIAHALTRGFSASPAMAGYLHGEMVAFGSIVQRYAQRDPEADIRDHARFVLSLGLPVCFGDFGGFEPDAEQIDTMALLCCQAPYIGNITPPASQESISAALCAADALGTSLKRAAEAGTA